jgi:hypothetical protein
MSAAVTKVNATLSLARTGLQPRGLDRLQAAAYIGVSAVLFDTLVLDGRMPQPKTINSRRVWDLRALDSAFDMLPDAHVPGRAPPQPDETDDVWSRARA